MVSTPRQQAEAVAYLVDAAVQFGYPSLQVDLEPSCWANESSTCFWPSSQDAAHFRSFLDDLAAGLSSHGKALSVAAAAFPVTQCPGGQAQYDALCQDEVAYLEGCASTDHNDVYNVSTCNCCSFTTWFQLDSLCAGDETFRVVNMDTYQAAPLDVSLFAAAHAYYESKGCGDQAVGLLAGQGGDQRATVDQLFAAVGALSPPPAELAVWVNLWADQAALALWEPHLEAFVASALPSMPPHANTVDTMPTEEVPPRATSAV